MQTLTIEELSQNAWCKTVTLSNRETLDCPRARDISVKHPVVAHGEKVLRVVSNGSITIHPCYESTHTVRLGKETLDLNISEPLSQEDWKHIDQLRGYHYRERLPFGRRGVLVATTKSDFPGSIGHLPVGFIEVGFAPICNSARDKVLDAEFHQGEIAWNRWRHAERGKYGHLIMGVSRVVVHPDYRGVGLGSELLKHCVQYVSNYWESRESKPIFMEIVADMLKYNTFPRKAGFIFVGHTEGNVKRVASDIRYQLKKLEECGMKRERIGVKRMQQRNAVLLRQRLKRRGMTTEEVLSSLKEIDAQRYFEDYNLFHEVVRLPKPTWMIGLTHSAHRFLAARVEELGLQWGEKPTPCVKPSGNIAFENVSITRRLHLKSGSRSVRTAATFGIPPIGLTVQILKDANFTIVPGDICVINGPSGCGKTTLLRLLARQRTYHYGHMIFPQGYRPKMTTSLPTEGQVITLLDGTFERTLRALATAGLSEPRIYIQDVSTLSEGQKERLRFAMLASSDANAWLIDDFAAFLDQRLTRVVSKTLRRMAKNRGVTLVLASPRATCFLDVLRPDVLLNVTSDGHVTVIRNPDQ